MSSILDNSGKMAEEAKPSGRKRGRPRTVTDDQEVPERRRKQLRLAQQAYRKRKETTIGNLQTRVRELEAGIEDISNSFLSFSDLLIEDQLVSQYPHIASALQTIIQQCVSLAKAGTDEPTEGAIIRTKKQPEASDNNTAPNPAPDRAYSETSTDVEDVIRSVATNWADPPTPPYQDQSVLPFGLIHMSSPAIEIPYLTPPLSSSPGSLDFFSGNTQPGRPWNIAQRLVQACCQNGYRLLVETPNHPSIQTIFGSTLSLAERNRKISAFYAVTQDKTGELVDTKANVLHTLRANMDILSDGQLQIPSRIWQIAFGSENGGHMDANEVQQYLCDKRVIFQNFPGATGQRDYTVSLTVDMPTFIKLLSVDAFCVGNGPTFQRQSVEKALRLATVDVPWDLDKLCAI
ncbi:uncharacterized protein N7515_005793 [Penicillium bovifimosum]|uniref:BZIP domain-containing protein n=1 Tax=Penicillium bovifimosum TaxID=126998 RepID=A0A9W9L070_9EURO|nr:uncharacterized protein N7515_005793 [Penicillium bovifimosum]KAJ5129754.1 hypothetical protein N7515_005793 [Penicillium bovifimosum]